MYFPNGTSSMEFQAIACEKCANYRDKNDGRGLGCPIFDLHLMWNYEQCKEDAVGTVKRQALEHLIPENSKAPWCSMFLASADLETEQQVRERIAAEKKLAEWNQLYGGEKQA